MRHSTYTLRIEACEGAGPVDLDALSAGLQDAEDVVNDRLPDGYYCKIDGPSGEGVDLAAVARLEEMSQQ